MDDRASNCDPSVVQPVACPYTDYIEQLKHSGAEVPNDISNLRPFTSSSALHQERNFLYVTPSAG
jgi:hypothetical protein